MGFINFQKLEVNYVLALVCQEYLKFYKKNTLKFKGKTIS